MKISLAKLQAGEQEDAMPLQIIRNDITKMNTDAIVNAANSTLLGGGGVDGCIHRAAGPSLLAECKKLGGCETGNAKITHAGNLPCKYVIHAVGPIWRGGNHGEEKKLTSCYHTSLFLAKKHHCRSVAFPLISSGIYGYPKDQALRVAVDAISEFLMNHEMTVYLVIFDRNSYQISEKLFSGIAQYIDDHYADAHTDSRAEQIRRIRLLEESHPKDTPDSVVYGAFQSSAPLPGFTSDEITRESQETEPAASHRASVPARGMAAPPPPGTFRRRKAGSLQEALGQIDESFSEMLLRKIDEKGMTDAQCYKKANVDRKLFSKIRSNRLYKPSKPTAIAFAIALELPLDETRDLLMKAGFALSHSSKFDIIIEYFIENQNYNIFEINEALFAFDQSLLGA